MHHVSNIGLLANLHGAGKKGMFLQKLCQGRTVVAVFLAVIFTVSEGDRNSLCQPTVTHSMVVELKP